MGGDEGERSINPPIHRVILFRRRALFFVQRVIYFSQRVKHFSQRVKYFSGLNQLIK